jgi:hypothetical protein
MKVGVSVDIDDDTSIASRTSKRSTAWKCLTLWILLSKGVPSPPPAHLLRPTNMKASWDVVCRPDFPKKGNMANDSDTLSTQHGAFPPRLCQSSPTFLSTSSPTQASRIARVGEYATLEKPTRACVAPAQSPIALASNLTRRSSRYSRMLSSR